MDNPQIAVLAEKVDALKTEVTALRADLKPLAELVARHDEQIKSNNTRTTWVGGIFAAIISFLLKDKLGL